MKLSEKDSEILRHTDLFRGTTQTVLVKMSAGTDCEMSYYSKGDMIYSRRYFKCSLGVILEGTVSVYKENVEGRRFIINRLSVGDMFGAAALFNDEKEYATELRALEPCRVIFFSQRLIIRGIERDSRLAENYIRYLSERVLFLNRKIFFLTGGTAEQRLSNFLLENFSIDAFTELPMTMKQLSFELNISRASIYRALDLLTESGAVEKSGKKIRIADIGKLEQAVGLNTRQI